MEFALEKMVSREKLNFFSFESDTHFVYTISNRVSPEFIYRLRRYISISFVAVNFNVNAIYLITQRNKFFTYSSYI